jgi:hypothetical protein
VKIEAVPATSEHIPFSITPEPKFDCIISPLPATSGIPSLNPTFLASLLLNNPMTSLRPDLLIIDDFGIKELSREEANDIYEIILERYEKKSNIVTSAKSPEEWQGLFPDPILGNSVLDRLAHRSYQVLMEGESLRKQNRPN